MSARAAELWGAQVRDTSSAGSSLVWGVGRASEDDSTPIVRASASVEELGVVVLAPPVVRGVPGGRQWAQESWRLLPLHARGWAELARWAQEPCYAGGAEQPGTESAGAACPAAEECEEGGGPWADVRRTLPKATLARIDQQMAELHRRWAQLTDEDLANDPLNELAGMLRDDELRDGGDMDRFLYGEE